MSMGLFSALRRVPHPFQRVFSKPMLLSIGNRRLLFSFGTRKELDVEGESHALHNNVLGPLNSKLLGPLEKYSDQLTPMPLVFVLGNHSRSVRVLCIVRHRLVCCSNVLSAPFPLVSVNILQR
jgi:hypothetical protein